MWVRGLKRARCQPAGGTVWSHPMWVRGLKLVGDSAAGEYVGRTPCGCVD